MIYRKRGIIYKKKQRKEKESIIYKKKKRKEKESIISSQWSFILTYTIATIYFWNAVVCLF